MATNTNQPGKNGQVRTTQTRNGQPVRRQTTQAPNGNRPVSGKARKAKKKKKIVIFAVEIMVLAVMLGALFLVRDFGTSAESGPLIVDFAEDDIVIADEVKANTTLEGYRNIALFGVDSTVGDLTKNTRSDSIMIASINLSTGDVKLMSVYRDTYLNIGNDTYDKCNAAYAHGGAEQAMTMLNMNLDLDITDFVTVGFEGLKDTIDGLGGIYIDVDSEELKHINSYQKTMAEDLKLGNSWERVTETGYQKLNGLQATAYCRIRYTAGDDYKRAWRQREVLQAIAEVAKETNIATLTSVANTVSNYVYTSLDLTEIIGLLGDIAKYQVVDEGGFPEETMRGSDTIGSRGSCVLALDLKSNVQYLHEFLFGETDYQVTTYVQDYSDQIRTNLAPYIGSNY